MVAVKDISAGDANGIGAIKEYTWKSALPYQLAFNMELTENISYQKLAGIPFGKLEGNCTWHFEEKNGITNITYYWNVITNKWGMNAFSFLLKSAFQYNHDVVMRWGAEGLAKKLNAELVSY